MAASSSRPPEVDVQGEERPIVGLYAEWDRYQGHVVDRLRRLTVEELGLSVAPGEWPIWAIAAHAAGTRVYWLCGVFGEPGAESTSFPDPFGDGWEDDLTTVRSARELVGAHETTWRLVQGALGRWTPSMLAESVVRERDGRAELHSRQSVLIRMITHDAFHAGEIAAALRIHDRPPLDLWPRPAG